MKTLTREQRFARNKIVNLLEVAIDLAQENGLSAIADDLKKADVAMRMDAKAEREAAMETSYQKFESALKK